MLILDRPINLSHGLILKNNVISVYRKILQHADKPYYFDQTNKKWWRYFSDIYGFYYSRVHRSYTIWLSNGLKKNIGVYMPFIMRMPVKRSKAIDNWKRRTFLYGNTMSGKSDSISWNNPRYFKSLNFSKFNINLYTKASIYSNFAGNVEHYAHSSYGSFGLDEESIFSGYNAKWHDIYRYWASFYRLSGASPTSFLIGVNSFYMWSGFFINLFDTTVTLYPEHYLVYYNNIYVNSMDNIFLPYMANVISFWTLNFNNLYYKLLLLYFGIFLKLFNKKFLKLKDLFLNYDYMISYRISLFYILLNYYVRKHFIFNIYNIASFKRPLFSNLFFDLRKDGKSIDNVYLKAFDFNKFNYGKIYNNIFQLSHLPFFNKINIKKNFILNIINLRKINCKKTFLYIKRNKQSKFFINIFKYVWTQHFYSKIRKKSFFFTLKKQINNLFSNGIRTYKSFNHYINFTFLSYKNRFNIGIRRILTYGKLFLRVTSKVLRHKFRLFKASSLLSNKGLFRTFLFTHYRKNILNKIAKFNYNFFFILSSLLRFNYGFSFTLLKFKRSSYYYKNLDNMFFYNLKYFIYKYFKFMNIYLKREINKKNDFLFIKRKSFFYRILYIYNMFSLRLNKRIYFSFKRKVRYFDYCYKGLNLLKLR